MPVFPKWTPRKHIPRNMLTHGMANFLSKTVSEVADMPSFETKMSVYLQGNWASGSLRILQTMNDMITFLYFSVQCYSQILEVFIQHVL